MEKKDQILVQNGQKVSEPMTLAEAQAELERRQKTLHENQGAPAQIEIKQILMG